MPKPKRPKPLSLLAFSRQVLSGNLSPEVESVVRPVVNVPAFFRRLSLDVLREGMTGSQVEAICGAPLHRGTTHDAHGLPVHVWRYDHPGDDDGDPETLLLYFVGPEGGRLRAAVRTGLLPPYPLPKQ